MHVVRDKEAQFGGILKNGRHFGGSTPIKIQVRMLVCPNLESFWSQTAGVMNDVVVGR